jgi:hypothetical protein
MATLADVAEIASRLPGTVIAESGMAFEVPIKGKLEGYAWAWAERVHPKKARVPNPGVLAIRVRSLSEKEIILGSDPTKFFTEPHYNNYPAVLVRLAAIQPDELEDLLVEAWRCKVPRELAEQVKQV